MHVLAAVTVMGALAANPAGAATLECVPDTVVTWSAATEIKPIPDDAKDTTFSTTIDTATGDYYQRAYLLSVEYGGTYTIVHSGDTTGPMDFVAVEPKSGDQLRIAIWHTPMTFLRIALGGAVTTGVCAEVPAR